MFLEQQISILKLFLKNHVTLKTEVIADESSVLHHRNKLHFETLIGNSYTTACQNILQYSFFILDQINAALVSIKCSSFFFFYFRIFQI